MTNCKYFVAFAFCLLNSKPFQRKHKDIFLHYQDTVITPKKFNVVNTISRCFIYGKISPNCSSVWLFQFLIFLNSEYNEDLTLHSLLSLFSFSLCRTVTLPRIVLFSFLLWHWHFWRVQYSCFVEYSQPSYSDFVKHWYNVAQVILCPFIALQRKADADFYCESTGSHCN